MVLWLCCCFSCVPTRHTLVAKPCALLGGQPCRLPSAGACLMGGSAALLDDSALWVGSVRGCVQQLHASQLCCRHR